ncbi:unnamed protein product, partial [Staurois parvus]
MTLGRKGLTSGAIKGLTVCCVCFTVCCVLLCMHAALYCSAMQSNTKQCVGADRGEICIVFIQTSPPSVFLGDRQVPVGNS